MTWTAAMKDGWRVAVTVVAAGTLYGASCSSQEIGMVLDSVQAVTGVLDGQSQNDDISFGDWVQDELEDM
ncbi:MAG: hypothetical protein KJ749_01305 [Planctomycetes bacterium]|nr:hypothetical protein [Planctomycetota bacterium]